MFRSGAVEQLKTHCNRLGVPLYDRGYDRDPTNVAAEAMRQAQRDGIDVVLVDTAGRMQDNEPLMQALSMLINKNNPDLVLFVGEALVGNDGALQLYSTLFPGNVGCNVSSNSTRTVIGTSRAVLLLPLMLVLTTA